MHSVASLVEFARATPHSCVLLRNGVEIDSDWRGKGFSCFSRLPIAPWNCPSVSVSTAFSPAPINLRSTRFTNVYLPDPGVCPHTGPMPALMAALWLFIVLSLSVLVYWEYKRALKRRPVRIPFDPFARMS